MIKDEKYIVFPRDKFEFMMKVAGTGWDETIEVKDAVVIRKQDVFAPPALDAYANAIQCVIEALKEVRSQDWEDMYHQINNLQSIADYFVAQAADAYEMKRKLPD